MVDKIKQLLTGVKQTRGAIKLFAMFKNSPDIDKWTFIVSAPWLDNLSSPTATALWSSLLTNTLDSDEQKTIARINVLKTNDDFVNLITNTIQASGEPVELSKHIGGFFKGDALIFESVKTNDTVSRTGSQRVWTLNPYRNPSINIYRNPSINPYRNPSINPYRNPSINPYRNPSINPYRNPSINVYRNPSINIYRNPSINPYRNPSIRPNSSGFNGLYSYSTNIKRNGYFIKANDTVLIWFNLQNELKGMAVQNTQNGYVLFNDDQTWVGQLVYAEESIYIQFATDNEHLGYAATF